MKGLYGIEREKMKRRRKCIRIFKKRFYISERYFVFVVWSLQRRGWPVMVAYGKRYEYIRI